MPISPVLENLEGVDDALKPLYTENDGKFQLELDGSISEHPSVAPLRRARDHEKDQAAILKSQIAALEDKLKAVPSDFSIDKWDKLKDGKADEAATVKIKEELEGRINTLEAELSEEREANKKGIIDRYLTDALAAAGVTRPLYLKAARGMISGAVTVKDGQPVVDTDMGDMALADHVKRWVAGEGKDFVTPPSGGSAKPGSQGGSAKKFSEMTGQEKVDLHRSNPQEYERLKAQG